MLECAGNTPVTNRDIASGIILVGGAGPSELHGRKTTTSLSISMEVVLSNDYFVDIHRRNRLPVNIVRDDSHLLRHVVQGLAIDSSWRLDRLSRSYVPAISSILHSTAFWP